MEPGGVELYLTGDANDYVGKGMAGGLIAIRPPVGSASAAMKQVLSATPACMARPVVVCMPQAARVNVSACGTPVLSPW
ncbi:glutamate synthase subunit alpha [Escherichia coli]|uniref:Glutamate synthase subunit alpha n=1 Tax=Escherichia coli TaxID=562 RepID=A0A376TS55_ECOLX|nr:glutamate synthase subunit alpha [Escherichia coli]